MADGCGPLVGADARLSLCKMPTKGESLNHQPLAYVVFEIRSARGMPNEICVNSAITACERAGSWAMALVLLSGMAKQAHLSPSLYD